MAAGAIPARATEFPAGADLDACRYDSRPTGIEIPPELHEEFDSIQQQIGATREWIAGQETRIRDLTHEIEMTAASGGSDTDQLRLLVRRDSMFDELETAERGLDRDLERRSRIIRIATELSARSPSSLCVPPELSFGDTCEFTRLPRGVRAGGSLGRELRDALNELTDQYDAYREAEREGRNTCPHCRMTGPGVDATEADHVQVEGYRSRFFKRADARGARANFETLRRRFSSRVSLAVRLQAEAWAQANECVVSSLVRIRETPVLGGTFRIYEHVEPTSAGPTGIDAHEGR